MPATDFSKVKSALKSALSQKEVNQLGIKSGQSQRVRVVTPYRLFLAVVGALAGSKVESLADLLREFNFQNKTSTAYKAFYNRLDRPGFAEFMRQMLCRLLDALTLRILEPECGSILSIFEDIVIQDGSSFALKDVLARVFPGRFTTAEPAAVELHATFSGFEDNVASVALMPDKEAERWCLPDPWELLNKLLLADRGYASVKYFHDLCRAGASFIVRLTRSYDPWVLTVFVNGKPQPLPKPIKLKAFFSQYQGCAADLDVEFRRGKKRYLFRVILLPGKEKWMTRLCTNLDRRKFPLELVAKLYRFRWQVELCFKEWKSYANLHSCDTGNEHIAEGLIWASLCAAILKRFLAHATQIVGGVPMSTRRVAMCAHHVIGPLFAALLCGSPHRLAAELNRALQLFLDNARRAHPERDRKTGRLWAGLAVVGVP